MAVSASRQLGTPFYPVQLPGGLWVIYTIEAESEFAISVEVSLCVTSCYYHAFTALPGEVAPPCRSYILPKVIHVLVLLRHIVQ